MYYTSTSNAYQRWPNRHKATSHTRNLSISQHFNLGARHTLKIANKKPLSKLIALHLCVCMQKAYEWSTADDMLM